MALAAPPPPADLLTGEQQSRLDGLDAEIEQAEAEIATLTTRNSVLAASFLGSETIRDRLHQYTAAADDSNLSSLLNNRQSHHQSSVHRLAFGVTAFPFIDPSPDTADRPLLGIRFDINRRGGTFDTAYYVFCKPSADQPGELALFKHTLPEFIPIERYRAKYLPLSDEGYGSEDQIDVSGATAQQDLPAFVSTIRSDLVAWRLRQDSIEEVQEQLGLKRKYVDMATDDAVDTLATHGVRSFEAVASDARFVGLTWSDGRVGRLEIGDTLLIDSVAVFEDSDDRQQRENESETFIIGQGATLLGLSGRLRDLQHKRHAS